MGRTVACGTVLGGRYEVLEPIGAGGHGTVYRGVQRPLGRPVAIKVLNPDADPAQAARFAREISLVQRLEHPNTVRLYDFGTSRRGVSYIVFELLRGRSLEAEIAQGPLPARRVGKIAVQILKSLMEAHALGIVHRDVKPANVLLVDYSGEPDFVKVLDFGVARRVTRGVDRTITGLGQMIGTPAYMAPEQVREDALTAGTDLYALGLVMAEAIAGRPVYAGSDGVVWIAQASPAPVPLPASVTHSILGPVVERATRKSPAERYASAREMIEDIERATARGAARAPPDPFGATLPVDPKDLTPPPVVAHWRAAVRPARDAPRDDPPSSWRNARLLAFGALAAMIVLTAARKAPQLGRPGRQLADGPGADAVHALHPLHPERLRSEGWTVEKVFTDSQNGIRTEGYSARRGHDGAVDLATLYVADYRDAAEARRFAAFLRDTSPTVAFAAEGSRVVWASAKDVPSAEAIVTTVLR